MGIHLKRNKPLWFWFVVLVLIFALWGSLHLWKPQQENLEGFTVPEGFVVEEATLPGLVKYPMFAVFDDQGKLFVMESSGDTESTDSILANPDFQILLLEDTDADGIFDHKTVYADRLPFPMGAVYLDGSLIVTASPDLVKLTDNNGDGVADEKEVLLSGWTLNHNAAILSGPFMGPDGWLYMADARRGYDILSKEFVHFKGKGARIWRCLPNGSQLQQFAGGGFDNAIELAFTPSGEVLGTMTYFTDPKGGFRDALMHWVEDGVYPKSHPVIQEDNLVRTGELMPVMHQMARVSPSGLMRYQSSFWGSDFEGDLFHAEFNTGRIVQTNLTVQGASFDTESYHFLTSQRSDFHPTDVLQEPDGNLLLVNTGGWFIAGCPLSRTAKPEVAGGIFRIKKLSDKVKADDLWGKKIPWKDLNMGQLAGLLEDPRIRVAEKAGELMLREPLMAIPYLIKLMEEHPEEQVRAKAVFLLFRTQNPRAWNQIIKGLDDDSELVKTAAARVLGMAEVNTAVDELLAVLTNNPPLPLARQLATALGQIGSPMATMPLLEAMESYPFDRYFEHAAIYALIEMKNEEQLLAILKAKGFNKAALIALDQKGSEKLEEKDIAPYLISKDSVEKHTAGWILKNHPEWEQSFLAYLNACLENGSCKESTMMELWPVFVNKLSVQGFLTNQMKGEDKEKKLLLINLLQAHPPKDFTQALQESLIRSMNIGETGIKEAIVQLIASMGIPDFNQELLYLAQSDSLDTALRLKAYQSLIGNGKEVREAEFRWIALQFLAKDHQQTKHLSASLIRNLNVTPSRLEWIMSEILPQVSDANIYYLLESLPEITNPELLHVLEENLLGRKPIWDKLSISLVKDIFQGNDKVLLDSLTRHQEGRLAHLEGLSMELLSGDVDRGREIFFGKGTCGNCHAVAERGGAFGPDLTNIGEIRNRHDILEAIIYPNASFAREYETMALKTKNQNYIGIIRAFEEGRYALAVGPETVVQIDENELLEIVSSSQSLMPAGLEEVLDLQELSNLMVYLESLPDGLQHGE
ncbi:PVC-type heme-binding CxxCH protein [Cyclobacterium plantarum]|uniref:PVC-type heme-binding CxxCH protein n=1 Tax=Cyclobacterium plantarum TaxID=2716263 RepID=UPI003F7306ED